MSTNTIEQNGRQAPLPNHSTPPSDPRIEKLSEHLKPVCRKYVWGTCNKCSHCKFRHELVYDEMKKILKFCHDFQNKQGCARIDCSYLHATSEEETLFLTAGQIPRVLKERYTAMCEPSNMPNFEGMPHMAMFVRAPPPPPPPPMMASAALPPPPPPPPQPQMMQSFAQVQQPPPPPPPPPATTHQTLLFSAPPPQQTAVIFPMNQPPPPVPAIFDASRPPPPLPKNIGKRRLDHCESSANKLRKVEESKLGDNQCENCIPREFRLELLKQQMDKLLAEEEYQSSMYKKKLEEYESSKEILRSLVSPEFYRILNEYIEGGPPQMQDSYSQFQNSFILGTSTVPKQFLLQLMEYVFDNPRNTLDQPISPPQSLSSFSRRSNNINNSSSDIVQAVLEVIRNSTNSSECLNIDGNKSNSPANGFHMNNGQKNDGASGSGVSANRYLNSAEPAMQSYQMSFGPSCSSHGSAPVSYPPYQPGVPPPVGRLPPYYPHQYALNSNTTPHGSVRMAPSSMTSNKPPAPTINHYSVPGKYPPPGPHYYHPYQ